MRAARIGAPIFILVLGAIARFAVADMVPNVNLPMIGLIMMIAGGVWLILELFLAGPKSSVTTERTAVQRDPSAGPARAQEEVVEREVRRDGV